MWSGHLCLLIVTYGSNCHLWKLIVTYVLTLGYYPLRDREIGVLTFLMSTFKERLPGPWERHFWVVEDLFLYIIYNYSFFLKINVLEKWGDWSHNQKEIGVRFSQAEGDSSGHLGLVFALKFIHFVDNTNISEIFKKLQPKLLSNVSEILSSWNLSRWVVHHGEVGESQKCSSLQVTVTGCDVVNKVCGMSWLQSGRRVSAIRSHLHCVWRPHHCALCLLTLHWWWTFQVAACLESVFSSSKGDKL